MPVLLCGLEVDLVAFDLGVEGGDFSSEQTRGLTLSPARLNQRTTNQFRFEAPHFSLQVERVVALPCIRVLD